MFVEYFTAYGIFSFMVPTVKGKQFEGERQLLSIVGQNMRTVHSFHDSWMARGIEMPKADFE